MRKFLVLGLALFVAAGAVFVACGGDDNKTIDVPGGGEINVGEGVPDAFPDDFPVYPGADSKGGYSGEQDGQQGVVALWETGDSAEDVVAFYEEQLDGDPWASEGSFNSAGTSIISFTNDSANQAGGVSISEVDGTTTISVFLGDDPGQDAGEDSDDGSSDDGSSDDGSSDDGDSSSDNGSSDGDSGDSSGSADLPEEVDLQDEYSEDQIPLPDDARVTASSSFSSGGTATIFVTLYTKESIEDLEQYFKDTLEAAGYADSFSSNSNGEVFLSYTRGADTSTPEAAVVNLRESDVEGYRQVDINLTIVDTE